MKKMNYREVFFTAVLVSGLAALLFGSHPGIQQTTLEAGAPQVVTVERAG